MEKNQTQINGNYIAFTSGDPCALTKREYFAAMAMQGLLSKEYNVTMQNYWDAAQDAVRAADALLETLATPLTT